MPISGNRVVMVFRTRLSGASGSALRLPVGHAVRSRTGKRKAGRLLLARKTRLSIILVGALGAAFALSACGQGGSSGTAAPPTATAATGGCAPVASDTLVLLSDDKNL